MKKDENSKVNPHEKVNKDASTKEVVIYAFGNIENAAANNFFIVLQQLLVVAMSINPIMIGMVLGLKSFWDAVTDPIMAHISDNAKTRWGRRKPFILMGGIFRIALLILIIVFFPTGERLKSNQELEQAKKTSQIEKKQEKEKLAASETETKKEKPKAAPKKVTPFGKIKAGIDAFTAEENKDQRTVIIYVLVALLLFATFTTINSVPYYAMGIELCSSYDGRTKVVLWRSVMDQIAGFVSPWMPALCFALFFTTAFQGMLAISVAVACIGIPSTIIMVIFTKERHPDYLDKKKDKMGLFKSIFTLMKNIHFMKIFFLFLTVGVIGGFFGQFNFFLNVYWVKKSAFGGSALSAGVLTVAGVIGIFILPAISWACKKFQKHQVLCFAILWMAFGYFLNWWLVTPENPYLQFALPFFSAIGMTSFYTVLATMMSDVTDIDELRVGERREAMFGAVNAFLIKIIASICPVIAGTILVVSGFNAELEFAQEEATILNMRILYSFVPAALLVLVSFILFRYPITREHLHEVQEKLKIKRKKLISER